MRVFRHPVQDADEPVGKVAQGGAVAMRARVKDKRVLALVKAFLKAGVLTKSGEHREALTGTPQGGILSPLIFNIALSALDGHVMEPWKTGGPMSTKPGVVDRPRAWRQPWSG